MAVVLVSSDLEEVVGLANQVLVLARGIPQGILKHSDATISNTQTQHSHRRKSLTTLLKK